ncbi:MAG: hypothetical protein V1694_10535 [Candidatus Eisenbacteria bacterium]
MCAAWLAVASPCTGAGLTPGFGCGLGSAYATLGMSGSIGSDHLRGEIAVGTEPFVWSKTYAAGATAVFLDPEARLRPRISVFVKSNASAVTVWEPEVGGEIQNDVEYEPFAGIAVLGGVDLRLFEEGANSFWLALAVGYQTLFAGMDKVNAKVDEFQVKYGPTGHDISVPRLEHFTFSVGLNVQLQRLQL